jgi:multidrug resistance efflux pump
VGRLIPLAFLAPEIVESIVEGRQPTTLTAEALTRRIELPLSWCSQKTALNEAADTARAQLAEAKARAQVARDEGDYSVLAADADGIVVETLAEPGQVVAAGQTVVKLAHSGPREATVNLPETVHQALGSMTQASLYDGVEAQSPARLRQLSDAAD